MPALCMQGSQAPVLAFIGRSNLLPGGEVAASTRGRCGMECGAEKRALSARMLLLVDIMGASPRHIGILEDLEKVSDISRGLRPVENSRCSPEDSSSGPHPRNELTSPTETIKFLHFIAFPLENRIESLFMVTLEQPHCDQGHPWQPASALSRHPVPGRKRPAHAWCLRACSMPPTPRVPGPRASPLGEAPRWAAGASGWSHPPGRTVSNWTQSSSRLRYTHPTMFMKAGSRHA
jgi:hypothetical protein